MRLCEVLVEMKDKLGPIELVALKCQGFGCCRKLEARGLGGQRRRLTTLCGVRKQSMIGALSNLFMIGILVCRHPIPNQ